MYSWFVQGLVALLHESGGGPTGLGGLDGLAQVPFQFYKFVLFLGLTRVWAHFCLVLPFVDGEYPSPSYCILLDPPLQSVLRLWSRAGLEGACAQARQVSVHTV